MDKTYVYLVGFSAALVSLVGATFSVTGLAKLFSGAPLAVMVMAGSLEFAKLVSASYLHRYWKKINFLLRAYMTGAVAILVLITSMGIFGYLSNAYQNTSIQLKNSLVRLDAFGGEDKKIQDEIARLQKAVDEIPENRVSKRIEMQKQLEPRFEELKKRSLEIQNQSREENLKKLGFQTEVGPLVFVAQAFGKDMDQVAHILILMFVLVFDPLAVCLVLATSFAIKTAGQAQESVSESAAAAAGSTNVLSFPQTSPPEPAPTDESTQAAESAETKPTGDAGSVGFESPA